MIIENVLEAIFEGNLEAVRLIPRLLELVANDLRLCDVFSSKVSYIIPYISFFLFFFPLVLTSGKSLYCPIPGCKMSQLEIHLLATANYCDS
jgi:hypothetical protein